MLPSFNVMIKIISLEESNIALVNVNEKILALSENSDNEYDKKLNEIEEE